MWSEWLTRTLKPRPEDTAVSARLTSQPFRAEAEGEVRVDTPSVEDDETEGQERALLKLEL
jgi:hypothetical protein